MEMLLITLMQLILILRETEIQTLFMKRLNLMNELRNAVRRVAITSHAKYVIMAFVTITIIVIFDEFGSVKNVTESVVHPKQVMDVAENVVNTIFHLLVFDPSQFKDSLLNDSCRVNNCVLFSFLL